jgi:uncharacterized protein (TIGR04255 family)
MNATHKFINPPLVEAVCEIAFSTKEWSPVIPGLFYNAIKSQFPIIQSAPIVNPLNQIRINFPPNIVNPFTQFWNNERDTLIQLSNNMLTINKLPKYDCWENYYSTICNAYKELKNVLNIENVSRVGLRTINKIDIENHSLEQLKKYLNISPSLPVIIGDPCNSIQMNFEFPLISNEDILALSILTLKSEPNYQAPLMFQLNMLKINNIINIEDWIQKAHDKLYDVFVSCLTQSSINKFNNE